MNKAPYNMLGKREAAFSVSTPEPVRDYLTLGNPSAQVPIETPPAPAPEALPAGINPNHPAFLRQKIEAAAKETWVVDLEASRTPWLRLLYAEGKYTFIVGPTLGKRDTRCQVPVTRGAVARFAQGLAANRFTVVSDDNNFDRKKHSVEYGSGGVFAAAVGGLRIERQTLTEKAVDFGERVLAKLGG